MKQFKIEAKKIGGNNPTLIIAEAGVNHNAKLEIALKLIDAACESGADIIKFQTFQGSDVVIEAVDMAHYQRKNLGVNKSQRKMLEELALPDEYYPQLISYAKKKGIIFMSTPHGGFSSVDFLDRFSLPAYKIGSGDLTNLPLLAYIAKKNKPLILSTGMATFTEIDEALKKVSASGNKKIAILHCTASYPCPYTQVNLNAMKTMIAMYPYPVGYSDHTTGTEIASYAVLLGAKIIEKHITLNKTLPGPDQKNSLEPSEFRQMVKMIRRVESLKPEEKNRRVINIPQSVLGTRIKAPTILELKNRDLVRKSLVWARDILPGKLITKKDIEIKRPGTGIQPRDYWLVIGKKTKISVHKDTLITHSQLI